MTFTFLGTAAANAFPEAFCKCPNCAQARTLGGPSLRKRSAALINNDLLIDLGPDIMSASHMHGCSLDEVRYCLQTHPHADHLDLSHLLSRSPAYGVVGAPVLDFYASRETLERAAATFETDLDALLFGKPTCPHVHVRRTWIIASAKLTSCHCKPKHSDMRRPVPAAKSVTVRSGSRRFPTIA